ncbi:MFS general substrate transporter [Guyanagaster necrorhizus]|uniref:MFS general substrate transporter n=1 Tax=Guyanagaster necrorhizus TaxID=856835 RepID=A0A9P8AQW2_9AGAR|nr:MFS general substrate transporter [Guyanagaster necrorhizus MCA 3950]KAG7444544.1 MFS general substrate transporter [Guyanagaster necrorhizus MCA 3950]
MTFSRSSTGSVKTVASTAVSEVASNAAESEPVKFLESKFERDTMRRVDWRMLPLLGLLYSVTIIDRSNMGIARTAGMGTDLSLNVGNRFSIASCVYFVPYILLQLPTNLVLRYFGARYCLTFYIFGWGCVELATGFVKNWKDLVLCRVLLGTLEAGFFPALAYIVSTWYTRQEVQTRIAAFFQTAIALSGFGAILSYVITLLKGHGGLSGWSWIFIIEGLFTVFCALLAFLFLPDFPDKNRFLTPEQTDLVLKRVELDRGDSVPDEITFVKVKQVLGDWIIWAHALMFMSSAMPGYAASYFTPIILSGMGYSLSDSLLLSAPPIVFAALCSFIFAWISDKAGRRAIFIAMQSLLNVVGLFLTGYANGQAARYIGIFLFSAGSSGCMSAVISYNANNIVGQTKRSVCSALIISFGGIGGILGTTVFRQQDYPRYIPGTWATVGAQILTLTLLTLTTATYAHRNKQSATRGDVLEGQPGFRYIL